jgi:hypothetical protein
MAIASMPSIPTAERAFTCISKMWGEAERELVRLTRARAVRNYLYLIKTLVYHWGKAANTTTSNAKKVLVYYAALYFKV